MTSPSSTAASGITSRRKAWGLVRRPIGLGGGQSRARRRRPQRAFPFLATGGQAAFLIIASPDSLAGLAAELRLPVESDADSARRLGKAFEEEMIRRLGLTKQ